MIRVRALPDTHTPHLLQVYAGLTDLARAGAIRLEYFRDTRPDFRAFHRGSLWAVVDRGESSRGVRVCVDLFDGGEIATPDGLEKCDVYFKRSFDPHVVAALPAATRSKVRPFGLNCFLLGDNDRDVARRVLIEWRLRRMREASLSRAEWIFRAQLVASAVTPSGAPRALRRRLVPTARAFEAPPGAPRDTSVFLQCRVWSPSKVTDASGIDALNEGRAALVRLLRRTFGARFLGGLVDTPFARQHYPDCVTRLPSTQLDYLTLVRRSRVGIVTRGIHGSIPWKTAEYLAASCCIVTERMEHVLPQPLEEGVNALTFRSANECVAACDRLLSSPEEARRMQAANQAFYRRVARPAAVAERWLAEALNEIA